MALIRVTGSHNIAAHPEREEEIILNTAHVMLAYPDAKTPSRGTMVHMAHGDHVMVNMTFEDFWTLVQRET